jgi:hypothetical protein
VVDAAILEGERRAHDKVFHGGGSEDLARSRQSRDSSADRHGDSREAMVVRLDLAGVQPCPKLHPLPSHRPTDRPSTPHGASGPVEDGEEPVAQGLDLTPTEAGQLGAGQTLMLLLKLMPAMIPHLRCVCGRINDVGEQDRGEDTIEGVLDVASNRANEPLDLGDQRVLVPRPGEVVRAGEFNVVSTIYLA